MNLYLAGNFVIMGNKKKEAKFKKIIGEKNYQRLCSFFYKKESDIVIEGNKK